MTDTTRIMDLPENITMSQAPIQQNTMQIPTHPNHPGNNQKQHNAQAFGNSYTPMDVHPNPYGHPPPSVPNIPKPSENFEPQIPQNASYNPNAGGPPTQPNMHQALPSRDIPMDPSQYAHDEEIQPNYIPPIPESVKRTTDYVRQFEEATEKKISKHEEEKTKQSKFDTLVEEGQIPILIAFLFFIFHMPVIDNLVFKHMSFLALHDMDGNFNMYGLLFKSSLFAGCFYVATQAIHLLSEF